MVEEDIPYAVKKEPNFDDWQTPLDCLVPPIITDVDSWLNDIVEIRLSSIGGRGLFVHRNIAGGKLKKGTNLGRYCPKGTYSMPMLPGEGACDFYAITVTIAGHEAKARVDGMDERGRIDDFLAICNHSFFPNVEICQDGSFQLIKTVSAGEELFVDYGMGYWKAAIPELQNVSQACIHALLSPNYDDEKKRNFLLIELKAKLDKMGKNIEMLWSGLTERTLLAVADRQNQPEEERLRKKSRNEQYANTLPSPLSLDLVREQRKRKDNEKVRKFNRPFNKRRKRSRKIMKEIMRDKDEKQLQQALSIFRTGCLTDDLIPTCTEACPLDCLIENEATTITTEKEVPLPGKQENVLQKEEIDYEETEDERHEEQQHEDKPTEDLGEETEDDPDMPAKLAKNVENQTVKKIIKQTQCNKQANKKKTSSSSSSASTSAKNKKPAGLYMLDVEKLQKLNESKEHDYFRCFTIVYEELKLKPNRWIERPEFTKLICDHNVGKQFMKKHGVCSINNLINNFANKDERLDLEDETIKGFLIRRFESRRQSFRFNT